jgi:hypothetical protein
MNQFGRCNVYISERRKPAPTKVVATVRVLPGSSGDEDTVVYIIREIATKLTERALIPLIMGLGLTGAFLAMAGELFTWAEEAKPSRERQ